MKNYLRQLTIAVVGVLLLSEQSFSQSSTLFFSGTGGNRVYKVSAMGGTPSIVHDPATFASAGPVGLDFDPISGLLYITGGNNWEVYEGDTSGTTTPTPIPNSGTNCCERHSVVIDPANGKYYFTAASAGVYSAPLTMDTGTTATLIYSHPFNDAVVGLAHDPSTGTLYANTFSEVISFDTAGNNPTVLYDSTDGLNGARQMSIDLNNGMLFLANRSARNIWMASTSGAGTPSTIVSGVDGLFGVYFDPGSDLVFYTKFGGADSVFSVPVSGGTPTPIAGGSFGGIRGIVGNQPVISGLGSGLASNPSLEIYPNPAATMVRISGDLGSIESMNLFDAFGKGQELSINWVGEEAVIDVSRLKPGLYILRTSDGTKEYSEKLLIE